MALGALSQACLELYLEHPTFPATFPQKPELSVEPFQTGPTHNLPGTLPELPSRNLPGSQKL